MDQVSPLSPGLRVRSPTSMIKNSDDDNDDEHVIVDIAEDIADDDGITVTYKKLFGVLSFVAIVAVILISVAGLFYRNNIDIISSGTTSSSPTQHTNELRLRGSNGVGNRNLDSSKITKDHLLVKEGKRITDKMIEQNLPKCAQEFIKLHRAEKGVPGRNNTACRGILIRDDIIITSKECSQNNYTFDFPDMGSGSIHTAIPHPLLNTKKDMINSPLGFLKANAPYHYHFIGRPVRRNRVFLSKESIPPTSNRIAHGKASFVIECDDENRPILYNYPIYNQKNKKYEMVPLRQLEGVLPDDILWEHEKANTTISIGSNSTTWWTRKISLEEEENTIKQLFEEYRGPVGSLSVPFAHSEYNDQLTALFESVDPRRAHKYDINKCYQAYYKLWKEETPFSGTHFFEWLHYGQGRDALDTSSSCNKAIFIDNKRGNHFFTNEERRQYEVNITSSEDKKKLVARYKHNNAYVSDSGQEYPHTYVWDLNGVLYIVPEVKHMTILGGRPALSAGELYIGKAGELQGIDYSSGHYKPDIKAVTMMYQSFKDQGLNVSATNWISRSSWSSKDCEEIQWQDIRITSLKNTTALRHSCLEVTTRCPTFVYYDDDCPSGRWATKCVSNKGDSSSSDTANE